MEKIIIIGASANREKFGNKAVRAYLKKGYRVYPINPKEEKIEGVKCYHDIKEINDKVNLASLYVKPEIGITIIKDLSEIGVKTIYVNPGTDSDELILKMKELGIQPLLQCSIVALGINPDEI